MFLEGSKSYTQNLTKAFDGYKSYEDVTLHCQGNVQVKTNKFALIFSSKLFKKIFETNCDSNTNLHQEYDILCPDFNPDSVAKVLELINSGTTGLSPDDVELRKGMISVVRSFQIEFKLSVTCDQIPLTSQKLTDSSDQRQNMEDLPNKIEVASQDMTVKCEMVVEAADEIEMSKSCDIEMTSQKMFEVIDTQERFTKTPKSSTDSEINTKPPMPYSCEYCNKRFRLLIGLQKHLKTHLNKSKEQHESAFLVEHKEPQMENDQQEIIYLEEDGAIKEIEDISLHCPLSDKCFTNLEAYDVHVKSHSEDSNSFNRDRKGTTFLEGEALEDEMDKMEMVWSETSQYGTEVSQSMLGKLKLWNNLEMEETLDQIEANKDRKKVDKNRKKTDKNRKKEDQDREMIRRRKKSILNMDQGEEDKEGLSEIKILNSTSGNTRFICPICKCRTTKLCHLKVHIGNHHYEEKVRKLVNKETFGCNLCPKTFKNMPHAKSHLLNYHQILNQILPSEMLKKLEDMSGARNRHSLILEIKKQKKVYCVQQIRMLRPRQLPN